LLLGLFLSSISFLDRVDLEGSIMTGASLDLAGGAVVFLAVLAGTGRLAGSAFSVFAIDLLRERSSVFAGYFDLGI
jgi:hypothetical protein